MELGTAMLLFLVLAYGARAAAVGGAIISDNFWIGLLVVLSSAILLCVIRVVTLNSLRVFFYDSLDAEANDLCEKHADEALALLAKGKYEELKILLIGKAADSEEAVREAKIRMKEMGGE